MHLSRMRLCCPRIWLKREIMQRSSIHLVPVFISLVLVMHGARAQETPLSSPAATIPAPHSVAEEVDRQILAELHRAQAIVAERCNDEDFVRRASLDITGRLPASADVTSFCLDTNPQKRARLIDSLLDSPEFGLNWARYWRDVIYIRATEQRSRSNQEEFTTWMASRWNQGLGWDSTVSAMLTALGNVEEHPETALIFAQGARTEDVTAEACRIFLGIQLQCANCHDHPSDVWKREQFHQLAAYFPRISERRMATDGKPVYEIVSVNVDSKRPDFMRENPEIFVRQFDRNNDHQLSMDELKSGPKRVVNRVAAKRKALAAAMKKKATKADDAAPDVAHDVESAEMRADERMNAEKMKAEKMNADEMNPEGAGPARLNPKIIERLFEFGDTNKDGLLTADEIKSVPMPGNKRRGSTEHHMTDLKNPDADGDLVDPRFFLDGTTLPHGQSDSDRRSAVAKAFTAKENPWFARAIVNRVWAEMLGEGFFMPVDDLGPNRAARYPEVLELLCQNFVASGNDPKWLVRTIANTETYQRKIASKPVSVAELPFASATPVPLRSDVVFNSLVQVFGVTEEEMGGQPANAKAKKENPRAYFQGPRFQFDSLFGIDPSVPKEDVVGNIPQSLMMMNSRIFRARMAARGDTRLTKILTEYPENSAALQELYLVVLARKPSTVETEICTQYLRDVKPRAEAFEDLMWSLVNSSEFISRR